MEIVFPSRQLKNMDNINKPAIGTPEWHFNNAQDTRGFIKGLFIGGLFGFLWGLFMLLFVLKDNKIPLTDEMTGTFFIWVLYGSLILTIIILLFVALYFYSLNKAHKEVK